MNRFAAGAVAGAVWAAALAPHLSQAQTQIQGIYTCIDAKGRKITSDRPIPECADREQQVLNPSGTVRATVGPTLTGPERAALERRKRRDAELRARQEEEKRRERALLMRYPNRAVHDKERAEALEQIDVVKQAAVNRVRELLRQRKELESELEFYHNDIKEAPPLLRRQFEDNDHSMAVQGRFIADQDAEKVRVNARFDEELATLKHLWAQVGESAQ